MTLQRAKDIAIAVALSVTVTIGILVAWDVFTRVRRDLENARADNRTVQQYLGGLQQQMNRLEAQLGTRRPPPPSDTSPAEGQ